MEPREPVVTYIGEDRSEAELRAVVGACFWCLRHFCATLYATPPGFAFIFVDGSRGLGLRVFAFYALTGRPLRGSRLRVSLRSLATPWQATAGLFYSAPGLKFRLRYRSQSPLQLPISRAKSASGRNFLARVHFLLALEGIS